MRRPPTYSCLERSVSFVNRILISMPVWGGHFCPPSFAPYLCPCGADTSVRPLLRQDGDVAAAALLLSDFIRKNAKEWGPANRGHSPHSIHHASRYFSNFDLFLRLPVNSFNGSSGI